MIRPHRQHPLWIAFIIHRLSGLALALFLPLHFYVLGLALLDTEQLDGFLALAEHPLAKTMEFGLVFLLAIHLFGGLRLLTLELFGWTNQQKTLVAIGSSLAFLVAFLFLLRAF